MNNKSIKVLVINSLVLTVAAVVIFFYPRVDDKPAIAVENNPPRLESGDNNAFVYLSAKEGFPLDPGRIDSAKSYVNTEHNISINYPEEFQLNEGDPIEDFYWEFFGNRKGNKLISIEIPKSFEDNTNFDYGLLTAGVSQNPVSVANCYQTPDLEIPVSRKTINGVDFRTFQKIELGFGTYDVTDYRALYDGKCYVVDLIIHYFDLKEFSKDTNIKEFDRNKVFSLLSDMLNTFRFTN